MEVSEFTAFQNFHPVALRAIAVINEKPYLQRVLETEWSRYGEQFMGAVLDSVGKKKGTHFFFRHNNEHGPASLTRHSAQTRKRAPVSSDVMPLL